MWLGGDGSREDFWKGLENHGPFEQGKEICSSFKSKELLQIKPTGKSGNKTEKYLKSKSFKNQGVTIPKRPCVKVSRQSSQQLFSIFILNLPHSWHGNSD